MKTVIVITIVVMMLACIGVLILGMYLYSHVNQESASTSDSVQDALFASSDSGTNLEVEHGELGLEYRKQHQFQWSKARTVQKDFVAEMEATDLIEGIKKREPAAMYFGLIVVGGVGTVLFGLLGIFSLIFLTWET